MPKARQFFTEILAKAGVSEEHLTALNEAINEEAELPNEVETNFYNNFLTRETALSNEDIRKTIGNDSKAKTLNQFDTIFEKRAEELGFSQETIAEIKEHKNTFEKEKLFSKALHDKINKTKSESLKDIQSQLDLTKSELRKKEEYTESLKQSLENEKQGFYKQATLEMHFERHPDWKGSNLETTKNRNLLAIANFNDLLKKYDADAHFDINEKRFIIAKKGNKDVPVYDTKHNPITFETLSTLAMEDFKPKKPAGGGGDFKPSHEPPQPGANGGSTRNTMFDQFSKVKT